MNSKLRLFLMVLGFLSACYASYLMATNFSNPPYFKIGVFIVVPIGIYFLLRFLSYNSIDEDMEMIKKFTKEKEKNKSK